jgi:methenyltetrahydrofolate cyclohydrolase
VDGCGGSAPVHLRSRLGILASVQAPSFRDLTLAQFGERLASSDPVPGGGSASAVAASLAASLVAMVATLSQNRPKYADHAALHQHVAPVARRYADEFLVLADEDAAAYAACAFALKLPRDAFADKEFRDQQIRETAKVAAEVPLRVVERCHAVLLLAESLAGRSNVNAASGHGAAENVLVNLPLIGTNEWTEATETRVKALLDELVELASDVHDLVMSGERRAALATLPEPATR